jgi:O-antigen ligase
LINFKNLIDFGIADRNYISSLLSFGAVVLFQSIITRKSYKLLLYLLFIIIIIAQILLLYRGVLLSTIAGVLYVLFTLKKPIQGIFISFMLLLTLLIIHNTGILDDFVKSRLFHESLSTGSGRTGIWSNTLGQVSNQSVLKILFGGGYKSHLLLTNGISIHNNYLEILVDFGVVGFVTYIFTLISGFRYGDSQQKLIIVCFSIISLTLTPYMYLIYCLILGYSLVNKNVLLDSCPENDHMISELESRRNLSNLEKK